MNNKNIKQAANKNMLTKLREEAEQLKANKSEDIIAPEDINEKIEGNKSNTNSTANIVNNNDDDFINKKKEIKETLNVVAREEILDILDALVKKNHFNKSVNLADILEKLYDDESKTFKFNIEKADEDKVKGTSFKLEDKYIKAFKKSAKKSNVSVAKYFNNMLMDYITKTNLKEKLDKTK